MRKTKQKLRSGRNLFCRLIFAQNILFLFNYMFREDNTILELRLVSFRVVGQLYFLALLVLNYSYYYLNKMSTMTNTHTNTSTVALGRNKTKQSALRQCILRAFFLLSNRGLSLCTYACVPRFCYNSLLLVPFISFGRLREYEKTKAVCGRL